MAFELLRIVGLCLALAGVETLHGIFRAAVLVPRIGKRRALRASIVSGSALAFMVCYLLVPGIGLSGTIALVGLGCVLAVFMATFDIMIGLFVMKLPWPRIRADFDWRTGNYLSIGLVLLATFPCLVMLCKAAFS